MAFSFVTHVMISVHIFLLFIGCDGIYSIMCHVRLKTKEETVEGLLLMWSQVVILTLFLLYFVRIKSLDICS